MKKSTHSTHKKKGSKQQRLRTLFLKALKKSCGNVSTACKVIKIHRSTFYTWQKTDPKFKEAVDEINEMTVDIVESELLKNIRAGNVACQIYFLKTKGRSRGWGEDSHHETDILKRSKDLAELTALLKKSDFNSISRAMDVVTIGVTK